MSMSDPTAFTDGDRAVLEETHAALLALRERVAETSKPPSAETIGGWRVTGDKVVLFAALAKAQGAFLPLTKNKTATVYPKDPNKKSYTFAYADLNECLDSVRPGLNQNGYTLTFAPLDGALSLVLLHAAGSLETQLPSDNPGRESIQDWGKSLTYRKRYLLCAALALAADDDDDGNQADGNQAQIADRRPAQKGNTRPKETPQQRERREAHAREMQAHEGEPAARKEAPPQQAAPKQAPSTEKAKEAVKEATEEPPAEPDAGFRPMIAATGSMLAAVMAAEGVGGRAVKAWLREQYNCGPDLENHPDGEAIAQELLGALKAGNVK